MKLALLLDRQESGLIYFEDLLEFLACAMDRGQERPGAALQTGGASLEDVCFSHLEQQLSRAAGRLLANRVRRPRASSAAGTCRRATADAYNGSLEPGGSVGSSPARGTVVNREAPIAVPSQSSSTAVRSPVARPQSAPRGRGGATDGRGAEGLDRCHLLYHQALFASRESAQLADQIQSLREQEEMRECTFKPRILSSRQRPPSPSCRRQPRNFESTVARMRTAQRRRQECRDACERVPRGENYERLRRLGTQPFSCYYKDRTPQRKPALMYVDVTVGHGRTGRIAVHEGDDLRTLAQNFAKTFQLDADMERKLEEHLAEACEERRLAELSEAGVHLGSAADEHDIGDARNFLGGDSAIADDNVDGDDASMSDGFTFDAV